MLQFSLALLLGFKLKDLVLPGPEFAYILIALNI